MIEVDIQTLARLLKLLERSVQAGEDLEPFGTMPSKKSAISSEKTTTRAKGRGTDSTQDKAGNESDVEEPIVPNDDSRITAEHSKGDATDSAADVTGEDIAKLERSFEAALEGVLAADCCIALLTSDRLAKQVRDAVLTL